MPAILEVLFRGMPPLVPIGRVQFMNFEDGRSHLAEWLFVETLDDIERRMSVATPSRYDMLMLAPLIRKLTIESPTLIEVLRRRKPRPVVVYRMNPHLPDPTLVSSGTGGFAVGDHTLVYPVQQMSPREFLNASVGEFSGQPLSVRTVIKHFSHVEGGVHLGSRDSTGAGDFVQALLPTMPHGLGEIGVRVLRPIARIILNGCGQLLEAVRKDVEAVRDGSDPRLGADPAERWRVVRPEVEDPMASTEPQ